MARRKYNPTGKQSKLPGEILEELESGFQTKRQQQITRKYRSLVDNTQKQLRNSGTTLSEDGQAIFDTAVGLMERQKDMTPGEVSSSRPAIKNIQNILDSDKLEVGHEEQKALSSMLKSMDAYSAEISTMPKRLMNFGRRNLPDASAIAVGLFGRGFMGTLVTKYGIDLWKERQERRRDITKDVYGQLTSLTRRKSDAEVKQAQPKEAFIERYSSDKKKPVDANLTPKQPASRPAVDKDQSQTPTVPDEVASQTIRSVVSSRPAVDSGSEDSSQDASAEALANKEAQSETKETPLLRIDKNVASILSILEGKKKKKSEDGEGGSGGGGFLSSLLGGGSGGIATKLMSKLGIGMPSMAMLGKAGIWGLIAAEVAFIGWGLHKSYKIIVDANNIMQNTNKNNKQTNERFVKWSNERIPELIKKRKEAIDRSDLSEEDKKKAKRAVEAQENINKRVAEYRSSKFADTTLGEKDSYARSLMRDEKFAEEQTKLGLSTGNIQKMGRGAWLKKQAEAQYEREFERRREMGKYNERLKPFMESDESKTPDIVATNTIEGPRIESLRTEPPILEKSVQAAQKKAEADSAKSNPLPPMIQQVNQSQSTSNVVNQGIISNVSPYGGTSRIDGMINRR